MAGLAGESFPSPCPRPRPAPAPPWTASVRKEDPFVGTVGKGRSGIGPPTDSQPGIAWLRGWDGVGGFASRRPRAVRSRAPAKSTPMSQRSRASPCVVPSTRVALLGGGGVVGCVGSSRSAVDATEGSFSNATVDCQAPGRPLPALLRWGAIAASLPVSRTFSAGTTGQNRNGRSRSAEKVDAFALCLAPRLPRPLEICTWLLRVSPLQPSRAREKPVLVWPFDPPRRAGPATAPTAEDQSPPRRGKSVVTSSPAFP